MRGRPLAGTPISPRQSEVLALMRKLFGERMSGSKENYIAISKQVGWKHHAAVRECLFALRAKGAVRSEGPTTWPTAWVIVASEAPA